MAPYSEQRASGLRWLAVAAGLFGGLGVLLGAGVAHALADWLQDQGMAVEVVQRRVAQADTAVRYHLLHSVVLLVLFSLRETLSHRWLAAAGVLVTTGIVLFSGSLYLLVLLNLPWFGAITPLGGLAWIAGWLTIAAAGFRPRQPV